MRRQMKGEAVWSSSETLLRDLEAASSWYQHPWIGLVGGGQNWHLRALFYDGLGVSR